MKLSINDIYCIYLCLFYSKLTRNSPNDKQKELLKKAIRERPWLDNFRNPTVSKEWDLLVAQLNSLGKKDRDLGQWQKVRHFI